MFVRRSFLTVAIQSSIMCYPVTPTDVTIINEVKKNRYLIRYKKNEAGRKSLISPRRLSSTDKIYVKIPSEGLVNYTHIKKRVNFLQRFTFGRKYYTFPQLLCEKGAPSTWKMFLSEAINIPKVG